MKNYENMLKIARAFERVGEHEEVAVLWDEIFGGDTHAALAAIGRATLDFERAARFAHAAAKSATADRDILRYREEEEVLRQAFKAMPAMLPMLAAAYMDRAEELDLLAELDRSAEEI